MTMVDIPPAGTEDEPLGEAVVDYFACNEQFRCYLPDGKQYVVHQTLNEGARRQFLNATNREVKLHRKTGDASLKMAAGDEKHALLESAIVDWHIFKAGKPLAFSKDSPGSTLSQFLTAAPPSVIDLIEKDIRKHNPWLQAEMSVEDIDEEIKSLQEMREQKVREQEGKAD